MIKNKKYGLKGKGIILYGPKGTGKSILLKALRSEPIYSDVCNFIYLQTHDITTSSMGGSSEMIDEIFSNASKKAHETGKLSVIILDDLENVFLHRGDKSAKSSVERTNAMLSHIDGLYDKGNVFIILTTNRPEDVDDAIIDRFDEVIKVEIAETDRIKFVKKYLSKIPLDDNIDFDSIVTETKEYNGRDFRRLSSESLFWYSENKNNGNSVTQEDVAQILNICKDKIKDRNFERNSNSKYYYNDKDVTKFPPIISTTTNITTSVTTPNQTYMEKLDKRNRRK